MRMPASTSKLLVDPTISCKLRTGGNMVRRLWAERVAAARKSNERATLRPISIHRLRNRHAANFNTAQVGRAHAVPLGQQQRVVTGSEGRAALGGARIVA